MKSFLLAGYGTGMNQIILMCLEKTVQDSTRKTLCMDYPMPIVICFFTTLFAKTTITPVSWSLISTDIMVSKDLFFYVDLVDIRNFAIFVFERT